MDEASFRRHCREHGYDEPELLERPAGLHNPEHSHDFDVVALVLEGELTVTVADGRVCTCRGGDFFELEHGARHSEQYGSAPTRALVGRRAA
ncbi:MAG: cupin domain-containing protein [Gammaproteobacteria bacterium]|nr:cupin domain-containing protein [Planctomycetota bacterium]MCP5200193.1 cupin domain-containing protein [Gammaproteobacteria bacterium]